VTLTLPLTTLQLAQALADAARRTTEADAALAILQTLHAHKAWVCRVTQTTDTLYEPYLTQIRPVPPEEP
jgi:hypothetical protein